MDDKKLYLSAFDGDGCVLNNRIHFYAQTEIINNYWDFFIENGTTSDPQKLNAAKLKTEEIINNTDWNKFKKVKTEYELITHKAFLERIIDGLNTPNESEEEVPTVLTQIRTEFMGYMDHIDPNLTKKIFLNSNREILQYILQRINTLSDVVPMIVCFSNRASYHLDEAGKYLRGTKSIYTSLADICEEVNRYLPPDKEVKLTTFCFADLFGNLPRGTSFNRIIAANTKSNTNVPIYHAHAEYDANKVSLKYAIEHDACKNILPIVGLPEDTEVIIDFIDDKNSILDNLHHVNNQYPHLQPSNVTANFVPYSGSIQHDKIKSVTGSGVVDKQFHKNVKRMVEMAGSRYKEGIYQEIDCTKIDFTEFLFKRNLKNISSPQFSLFSRVQEKQAPDSPIVDVAPQAGLTT